MLSGRKGWEEAWMMPANHQEDPKSCPKDETWNTGCAQVTQLLSGRTGVPSAGPGTRQSLSLRGVWGGEEQDP